MVRLICCILALFAPVSSVAKDFGSVSETWEIIEPDLLQEIYKKLHEAERAGEFETLKKDMQDRARAYVDRPPPVSGLSLAVEERVFEVDLGITVTRDIADHRGQVFVRAGTRINPLDYSRFQKDIVVIDGDDPQQVKFAVSRGDETNTLIVLVQGSPLDLTKANGRRFFFDQNGQITKRFNLRVVPSLIYRQGQRMMVREVPMAKGAENAQQ
jgi:conjugal transfer pilus assembly protein TraW